METLNFDIVALVAEFALYGPKDYEPVKAFIEAHNMTFEYIKMGKENNKMIKFMNRQEKQLISGANKILWDYKWGLDEALRYYVGGISFAKRNISQCRIEHLEERLNCNLYEICNVLDCDED